MKVLILYRPLSEQSRAVEMFVRDFRHFHQDLGSMLEVIDIDSKQGISTASLYGVMSFPSILAVADDGVLLREWNDTSLPLLDDVASYLYA